LNSNNKFVIIVLVNNIIVTGVLMSGVFRLSNVMASSAVQPLNYSDQPDAQTPIVPTVSSRIQSTAAPQTDGSWRYKAVRDVLLGLMVAAPVAAVQIRENFHHQLSGCIVLGVTTLGALILYKILGDPIPRQ
jgi:hypothetical protein